MSAITQQNVNFKFDLLSLALELSYHRVDIDELWAVCPRGRPHAARTGGGRGSVQWLRGFIAEHGVAAVLVESVQRERNTTGLEQYAMYDMYVL